MARSSVGARAGRITPVSLVVGGEDVLISRAVGRALRVARSVDPQAERIEIVAGEPAAQLALTEALAPGLFAVPSVVVLRDVQAAAPGVAASLCQALVELPPDTWVIVVHPGGKNLQTLDEIRAAVPPKLITEVSAVAPKRGRATREFLAQEAASAGASFTDDALDVLVAATGSDLGLQLGALAQIIADSQTSEVGVQEVTAAFSGVSEVAGYELADSVWERRAGQAMSQLRWGIQSESLSATGVTWALAASLRQLVRVATAPRGMSDNEVASLAGVPPFKVRQLRQQVRRWRPEHLAAATVSLAAVDAGVKGGLRPGETLTNEQKEYLLCRWILRSAPSTDH